MVGQLSRGLLLTLLVAALACASDPATGPGDRAFPTESTSTSDPGLSGRSSTGMSSEGRIDLRTVYFDFDESALRADSRRDLEHNAQTLRANPDATVEIQGNCDERGSAEYNLALGQRRAEAAKQYLQDLGIESGRLQTISFGEERPAVRGGTESAWAKNRRDDFVVR